MASSEDVIIAVMGATGAGKTTLINKVTGGALGVGHGLVSMTDTVQVGSFELGGRRVHLIDTPGFDDTNKSDTDILNLIASHLAAAYKAGRRLTGLLYLHRITDNRVGGVSYKNMRMFHKLCGDAVLKNVVLCTTMWSGVSEEVGAQREAQLTSQFWQEMIRKGASTMRYDGTEQDAQRIISHLMSLGGAPPLQIQKEIVDQGKSLIETAAGAHINEDILRLEAKHRAELEEIKKDFQRALAEKDVEMQRMITNERKAFEAKLAQAEKDRKTLSDNSKTQVEAMERRIRELEAQRRKKGGSCTIF
ncbi:hypothetical protein BOTBODRAFT_52664 [Botryobasidium botryosum FD-172 SS1]|uniref:G domain-containing protein n=1 Tax=Botryobasidium botryosum (strain FD-172 SS1) TaxID=930990 RepID=A0A067MSY9_BOTB1|nr:hypothetical protein BOTBODRAFT_52664 [Botryobasidium botryosum FD-172 SS1]